jgi:hypothetical protein
MRVVAAALIALVSLGGLPGGQTTAGFGGRWVLVAAKPVRPGYDQFWLGTEVDVTETARTVEIARIAPAPARTATFVLGKETRNDYVVNGVNVQRDSRATLRDGLLLISTETTTDKAPRRLSNILRWTMEPDGTLTVMDTEICGNGECPSIITTLSFKRKP